MVLNLVGMEEIGKMGHMAGQLDARKGQLHMSPAKLWIFGRMTKLQGPSLVKQEVSDSLSTCQGMFM